MTIVVWGIIIIVGIMILMMIGLAISIIREIEWFTGILVLLFAASMILFEYMIISKAIAENIIGG